MKRSHFLLVVWPVAFVCSFLLCSSTLDAQRSNFYEYRTYDGTLNDLGNLHEGKAGIPFLRKGNHSNYQDDGHSMAANVNPRTVSNLLCHQEVSIPDEKGLSSMVFTFLQFIDHDLTATEGGTHEYEPIHIPPGDPYFDPFNTGQVVIPFTRSGYLDPKNNPGKHVRQQINTITAWLDGSGIYGSDEKRAKWLRTGECGKLKTSSSPNGDLLPCNTPSGDCSEKPDPTAPKMDGDHDHRDQLLKVFVAGDVRANEQPGLTALHTIFMREHNRICEELRQKGKCNDEENYQYARKMVGGLLQSILYNELLPMLGIQTGNDRYSRAASPEIFNTFATAAFRLGHTMVSNDIPLISEDCGEPTDRLSLAEAFFNPSIIQSRGVSEILRGLQAQTQEKIDGKLVHGVRNFLFGAPGAGGLDLAALNIQRSRDHGIPDYNSVRKMFGLKKVVNWSQITTNRDEINALKKAFGKIDKIDAWIGMLLEKHMPGKSVGELLNAVLSYQFREIKKADRFYYTRDRLLSKKDITTLSKTRLADVIRRNTVIEQMDNVFYSKRCIAEPGLVYCHSKAKSSDFEWIHEVHINDFSNRSGNNNGYGDFTNSEIRLLPGEKASVFLRGGFKNGSYQENWRIWLDSDGNGQFEDAEMVYFKREYQDSYGKFEVPLGAKAGKTRMRISMSYYHNNDACGHIKYGEVEDYTVEIKEAPIASSRSADEPAEIVDSQVNVNLYPNPAAGPVTLSIYSPLSAKGRLMIMDPLGRIIEERHFNTPKGQSEVMIHTEDWAKGIYNVVLLTGKEQFNRPFIKI